MHAITARAGANSPPPRIRKVGRWLMSLASIGGVMSLGMLVYALRHLLQPATGAIDPKLVGLGVLGALAACMAQLVALNALRHIGKLLATGHTISPEMARQWHRLFGATVASVITTWQTLPAVERSLSLAWLGITTCLGLFAVMHLLDEALRLRSENESFI